MSLFVRSTALFFLSLISLNILLAEPAAATDPEETCYEIVGDDLISANPGVIGVIQAMYDRAGLCSRITLMAAERAAKLLISGQVDGNTIRTSYFVGNTQGKVIAVEQPLFTAPVYLISLADKPFGGLTADMRGVRVGHYAGMRWIKNELKKTGAESVPVQKLDEVNAILDRGRVAAFSATDYVLRPVIARRPKDAPQLIKHHWSDLEFYHVLAPQHKDVALKLRAALIELIHSGEAATLLTSGTLRVASLN